MSTALIAATGVGFEPHPGRGNRKVFGNAKRTVGLDIGASSVKAVEIERRGHEIRLVSCGVAALDPDAIVDGEIMDRQLVIRAIQDLFESRKITRRRVVSGVCGRGVIVKKIAMERMRDEEAAEAIYWEAEQHVPYDINDVVLDFKILNTDIGPTQMQVLLVAAKRNLVLNHAEIVREAGLVLEAVDINSFAIQNTVETNHDIDPEEVVALLNVGAEIVNFSIIQNGIPLYTQDLSTGGNRLIHAIQRTFQVSGEEAIQVMLQGGNGKIDITVLLEDFCSDLSAGVDKSLTYLRTSGDADALDRILLSGGCTRIPGFVEGMANLQSVPVQQIEPLRRLHVDPGTFAENESQEVAARLAVVVGLALRKGRSE